MPISLREMGGRRDLTVRIVVVGRIVVSRGEEPLNLRTWIGVEEAKAAPTGFVSLETTRVRCWTDHQHLNLWALPDVLDCLLRQ